MLGLLRRELAAAEDVAALLREESAVVNLVPQTPPGGLEVLKGLFQFWLSSGQALFPLVVRQLA